VWGLALSAVAIYFVFLDKIQQAIDRMNAIGQDKDDSAAGRGYDRILHDFQYTILGAGEGEYWRHDSVWKGEIHSTFGTLLFCYGVVGLALFIVFLFYVYRSNRVAFLLYLMPVFVYSVVHNGLRATPFWMLLALLAVRRKREVWSPVPATVGPHLPTANLDRT
jgi:predicted RND superfamily exporter protein